MGAMNKDVVRILPIGGLGEIGMNCLILESHEGIVLIDCGIQFPDASYTGIDLLTPDFSVLEERFGDIKGVIVTHGHDDHIGAIPFLARHTDLDVYCTPFPRGLLQNKFTEHTTLKEVRFHEIKPREKFSAAGFTFDPIQVQHSIIESLAFAIESPAGVLIHTGDFKHEANEIGGQTIGFEAFAEYGDKGVQLLMSDSTNAERTGHTLSELEIAENFLKIFEKQTGRILIGLFASNIRRVEHLLKAAKACGKKVAFGGRSMHSYSKLAHDQKSLDIPEGTLILLEDIGRYPDDQVIVMLTGSQAEPQSALVRIASGVHKDVKIRPGDTVMMSSRFIPGNERNIAMMIDSLYRSGAEVVYESFHKIHVSGHGHQEELLLMLKAARPKFFIPVHGEFRHLKKHATLAESAGVKKENTCVVEDGQVVELSPTGITLGARLELQKTPIVDGKVLESGKEVFHQRSTLSKTGVVYASLTRDKRTLRLVAPPQISTYGLLYFKGEKAEAVLEEACDLLEEWYREAAKRDDLADVLKLELRRFFKKHVSYKPIVVPLIQDI